jgi:hypothetical protein
MSWLVYTLHYGACYNAMCCWHETKCTQLTQNWQWYACQWTTETPPPSPTFNNSPPPQDHINTVELPQEEDVKYLRLHLDRTNTDTARNQPHQNVLVTRTQVKLSTSNKLIIYKAILKPIWTYGIQLWGTASTSNIEILKRFKSKALCIVVDAPWDVLNTVIRRDLQTPTVKEEIRRYSSQYSARLSTDLIVNLMELPDNRQLRRHLPNGLPTRFLV